MNVHVDSCHTLETPSIHGPPDWWIRHEPRCGHTPEAGGAASSIAEIGTSSPLSCPVPSYDSEIRQASARADAEALPLGRKLAWRSSASVLRAGEPAGKRPKQQAESDNEWRQPVDDRIALMFKTSPQSASRRPLAITPFLLANPQGPLQPFPTIDGAPTRTIDSMKPPLTSQPKPSFRGPAGAKRRGPENIHNPQPGLMGFPGLAAHHPRSAVADLGP